MADGRHKRDTDARPVLVRRPRFRLVAAPVALAVTGGAVALGMTLQGSPATLMATDASAGGAAADAAVAARPTSTPPADAARSASRRAATVSRSVSRTTLLLQGGQTRLAVEEAGAKQYAETALDLWSAPGGAADKVGELATGQPAVVTGRVLDGRQEVVVDGVARWVTSGHLGDDRPDPATGPDAPLSDAPCPDSSVERGLKPETVRVYRALCHAFPQVTQYLGFAPRSEHDTGNAIDAMVYGDKALGDRIAAWAQAHAAQLDLFDILWWHRIWTPVRASEGWRMFADRGSPTANHMDHVHLGTN